MRTRSTVLLAALVSAAGAATLFAGPLDPPAGPVVPTMKTLAQVEPRVEINPINTPGDATCFYLISQPGSYYLSGDVDVAGSKTAIKISASNVTIDLNGFTIRALPGNNSYGIVEGASLLTNIVIRNGTVRDFKFAGIELVDWNVPENSASNGRISDVAVIGNGGSGINVYPAWIIDHCVADQNGGFAGIEAGPNSVISHSVSRHSKQCGFSVASGEIRDCVASGNNQTYFANNDFPGISSDNSLVVDCTSNDNRSTGILGDHVVHCVCDSNERHGFIITGGSVKDCSANFNFYDGFSVSAAAEVSGNFSSYNGQGSAVTTGAGYSSNASGATFTNNSAVGNDRGFNITVAGNFVYSNTAASNTSNYVIVAGNRVGVIVVPTNSAAINGSSGGGLGTTDPHANFAE